MSNRIRIGVSSCLLGEKVRYDGDHKRTPYITDVLGQFFDFVPVCPESELGMGIPREPIHLEGDPAAPRLLGNTSATNWTARMNRWAARRVRELGRQRLDGYLLKSRSPSCGLERVKVKGDNGRTRRVGSGLFALALRRGMPLLPVEEETGLEDFRRRENWMVRVFAYRRLREVFAGRYKRADMVDFHQRHACLLMAHSRKHFAALEQLVAAVGKYKAGEFRDLYSEGFMAALQTRSTTRKNVGVLRDVIRHFRDRLEDEEQRHLADAVERYGDEAVPLIVPLTLISFFLHRYGIESVGRQWYLDPQPEEMLLRNHF